MLQSFAQALPMRTGLPQIEQASNAKLGPAVRNVMS
jgi:hypothetical protein